VQAEVGEFGFGWIPENLFFVDPISGVTAELVVPDAGATATGVGGGKDRYSGANISVMGGMVKVMEAALVNFFLGA